MRAHGHAGAAEVSHQPLFGIHGTQRRFDIRLGEFVEQRPGVADGALDLPEGIAAMKRFEEIEDCRLQVSD